MLDLFVFVVSSFQQLTNYYICWWCERATWYFLWALRWGPVLFCAFQEIFSSDKTHMSSYRRTKRSKNHLLRGPSLHFQKTIFIGTDIMRQYLGSRRESTSRRKSVFCQGEHVESCLFCPHVTVHCLSSAWMRGEKPCSEHDLLVCMCVWEPCGVLYGSSVACSSGASRGGPGQDRASPLVIPAFSGALARTWWAWARKRLRSLVRFSLSLSPTRSFIPFFFSPPRLNIPWSHFANEWIPSVYSAALPVPCMLRRTSQKTGRTPAQPSHTNCLATSDRSQQNIWLHVFHFSNGNFGCTSTMFSVSNSWSL